ncbi:hypothetical protein CVT24_002247 [Panaeolus cyanescens]|uniref:Uncharacterized protein n=1 Tax=Panaeolus cyanescens TaxID=181874 RepID=A0A409YIB6_9AGAR|nr:hypothetical protein CVT24_002247 [Panaeolus cyanescens]
MPRNTMFHSTVVSAAENVTLDGSSLSVQYFPDVDAWSMREDGNTLSGTYVYSKEGNAQVSTTRTFRSVYYVAPLWASPISVFIQVTGSGADDTSKIVFLQDGLGISSSRNTRELGWPTKPSSIRWSYHGELAERTVSVSSASSFVVLDALIFQVDQPDEPSWSETTTLSDTPTLGWCLHRRRARKSKPQEGDPTRFDEEGRSLQTIRNSVGDTKDEEKVEKVDEGAAQEADSDYDQNVGHWHDKHSPSAHVLPRSASIRVSSDPSYAHSAALDAISKPPSTPDHQTPSQLVIPHPYNGLMGDISHSEHLLSDHQLQTMLREGTITSRIRRNSSSSSSSCWSLPSFVHPNNADMPSIGIPNTEALPQDSNRESTAYPASTEAEVPANTPASFSRVNGSNVPLPHPVPFPSMTPRSSPSTNVAPEATLSRSGTVDSAVPRTVRSTLSSERSLNSYLYWQEIVKGFPVPPQFLNMGIGPFTPLTLGFSSHPVTPSTPATFSGGSTPSATSAFMVRKSGSRTRRRMHSRSHSMPPSERSLPNVNHTAQSGYLENKETTLRNLNFWTNTLEGVGQGQCNSAPSARANQRFRRESCWSESFPFPVPRIPLLQPPVPPLPAAQACLNHANEPHITSSNPRQSFRQNSVRPLPPPPIASSQSPCPPSDFNLRPTNNPPSDFPHELFNQYHRPQASLLSFDSPGISGFITPPPLYSFANQTPMDSVDNNMVIPPYMPPRYDGGPFTPPASATFSLPGGRNWASRESPNRRRTFGDHEPSHFGPGEERRETMGVELDREVQAALHEHALRQGRNTSHSRVSAAPSVGTLARIEAELKF